MHTSPLRPLAAADKMTPGDAVFTFPRSLDQLLRSQQHRTGNVHADPLRASHVDGQVRPRQLVHRQVGRRLALQHACREVDGAIVGIDHSPSEASAPCSSTNL